MSDPLVIQSHKGPYSVFFEEDALERIASSVPGRAHYLVDARVAALYRNELKAVLSSPSVLLIEALETNKALEKCPAYVEHLVARGIRRGHMLVAIGGGIVQDIACFLGAILLRGIDWYFYPTTLLAQADSCIGSKSSINVGSKKNIVGTFTPPARIFVTTRVLASLDRREIQSGIGEMLKVHVIDGPAAFDEIAADYARLLSDPATLQRYVRRSLEIKKKIIEQDEFDRGIRNVMNLGHSFGHAIESATHFGVPHGIAVTIGIDMANYAAVRLGRMDRSHFTRMHSTLAANYAGYVQTEIPLDPFLAAIANDKKNTDAKLSLILPDAGAIPRRTECPNDAFFRSLCSEYFARIQRDPAAVI